MKTSPLRQIALLFLGFWLLISPMTFGYLSLSEKVCGALILFLSFYTRKSWALWGIAGIGLWLEAAPLFFHSTALIYLNDTLIGVLLIASAVLFPGENHLKSKDSPSLWKRRIPIIFLGMMCWFMARYLAAFQLGFIDSVWDPFFGNGSIQVLTSKVSKSFPVSDAGLGALAYTLEVLLGCIGGENRWKTMPGVVLLFGLLVVPVGLVSVVLILLQPLVVGAWCTLCLMTAACMLMMMVLSWSEVKASFLLVKKNPKTSLWKRLT